MTFNVQPVNRSLESRLNQKIDQKTKPVGSLGELERIAVQVGLIQNTLHPELKNPHIVVFAGDHGLAAEGVSAYPQKVTGQMVLNFLSGGAAINVLTRQHGIGLTIVDAGVSTDFREIIHPGFRSEKIAPGTRNSLSQPAMSADECRRSIQAGAEVVKDLSHSGTNIIGFGEMGIGNSSAAALLMCLLTGLPAEHCIGKGTGVEGKAYKKKISVLKQVLENRKKRPGSIDSPLAYLQDIGGYEMAMMYGAMLKAAELGMIVLVDGFISSSVFLCACKTHPELRNYALFCHQSEEKGHQVMLEELGAGRPVLNLAMRLGEGSGCAAAWPLIQSSVKILNEMASFDEQGITNV